MEIRLRYEYGENLKDLAIEYKIPLATLKSKQKKSKQKGDTWIKGFRSKEGYEYFVEDEAERKKLILDKINNEMMKHLNHAMKLIEYNEQFERAEIENSKPLKIYKAIEEAMGKRIDNIARIAEIKKDVAGVYTPEKQIVIDKLQIEMELKRKELEEKEIELQIKKDKVRNELEITKLKKKRLEKEVDAGAGGMKLLE